MDSTVQYISKYHTIADFSFTNQNGKTITQKDYEGKIYVADFFFTTCGSICPKMTTNMVDVQKAIKNNPKVMLLSHTVFPETDSVPVLKAYAKKYGVIDGKVEFGYWRQKRNLYDGQKILFGRKTWKTRTNYMIWFIPKILFWWIKKEGFVVFMTVQRKKRCKN